jgi:signal transduction histidine kinase
MTPSGYTLIGLTVVMAALVAVLMFALLRFSVAARSSRRHTSEDASHVALLSSALHDAVAKLRAQEQAMSVRAEASEQLSGQIVDSLTAGFLLVDRSGRIEIMNQAGRRMLGVTADAAGADYRALLAAAPPLVAVIDECFTTATPIVRRTLQLHGPPGPSHLGVTVSPLAGGDAARGVICLFSDLTTVVDLEERLRMKETLARLGELTAGIAHEFRNGLATIHGYSRLIDPEALPPHYRPYIEGLRQETEALGKVVTNFLQFARPEQIVLGTVALGTIIQRAADDLRHELPPATELIVAGEFSDIQGDDVLLRQVFSNLIRNAAQACEGAGIVPSISIDGHVHPHQRVCDVWVSDNGPGIPETALVKVFQPFFTTRSNGTGLGLAIVQKIVVIHNGRVTATRSPRGGASIQMTFPLVPGAP